ncbi:hypothetical protein C8T65DRAFT_223637 [Cerioporus squamosus]|nr:hypothetical protein C8T65DRAFT_223637 [Cerioporus squamosus]
MVLAGRTQLHACTGLTGLHNIAICRKTYPCGIPAAFRLCCVEIRFLHGYRRCPTIRDAWREHRPTRPLPPVRSRAICADCRLHRSRCIPIWILDSGRTASPLNFLASPKPQPDQRGGQRKNELKTSAAACPDALHDSPARIRISDDAAAAQMEKCRAAGTLGATSREPAIHPQSAWPANCPSSKTCTPDAHGDGLRTSRRGAGAAAAVGPSSIAISALMARAPCIFPPAHQPHPRRAQGMAPTGPY